MITHDRRTYSANLQPPDALLSKVRAAVQMLAESAAGGVLDPHAEADKKKGVLRKSVFEVSQEKHPHSALLILVSS